jgi:hypothetical protein
MTWKAYSVCPAREQRHIRHALPCQPSYDEGIPVENFIELPARHHLQSIVIKFLANTQRRTIGTVSNSSDENNYRNLAVNGLRPSELHWALNHDAVHGIAYAFKNPVAVAEASDDPNDDRKTYLIRVKRDDLAEALAKINEWIVKNPGKAGMHAFGFVRALSREGLERVTDDEERR